MTVAEYTRLIAQIAVLKEVAEDYPNECMAMRINPNLFPEVQWSDYEPTKVKLVIEK